MTTVVGFGADTEATPSNVARIMAGARSLAML
jgi:hypothetical protein